MKIVNIFSLLLVVLMYSTNLLAEKKYAGFVYTANYRVIDYGIVNQEKLARGIKAYIDGLELKEILKNRVSENNRSILDGGNLVKYPFVSEEGNCFRDVENNCDDFTIEISINCNNKNCNDIKDTVKTIIDNYIKKRMEKLKSVTKSSFVILNVNFK